MAHSIVIPRSKLEPFLLRLGFENLTKDTEVCFTRKHHRGYGQMVKVFTTIPAGCTETTNERLAILVKGLGPRAQILYEGKILRTYPISNTLNRILFHARMAYKACNEYYKKNLKPWVQPHTTIPASAMTPAPQMVSDYRLGQINGFFRAASCLKEESSENLQYYSSIIKANPQNIETYIQRLLNSQILCLKDKARTLIPKVQ